MCVYSLNEGNFSSLSTTYINSISSRLNYSLFRALFTVDQNKIFVLITATNSPVILPRKGGQP